MTFYHLAVHHLVHTCPASRDPHIWATTRTVIGILDGGKCEQPKTIGTVSVPCGRWSPAHKQCRACRVTTIERSVTIEETGAIQ